MRRFFILFLLVLTGQAALAQTYYYKVLYAVKPSTGEKMELSGGFYMTFTNGKQTCYESDADGFKKESYDPGTFTMPKAVSVIETGVVQSFRTNGVYSFKGEGNGIRSYVLDFTFDQLMMGRMNSGSGQKYIRFSSDYSRLNIEQSSAKVIVAVRGTRPGEESSPSVFY